MHLTVLLDFIKSASPKLSEIIYSRIEAGLSAPAPGPGWGRAFAPARTSKKFKFFVSNREAADNNILLGGQEKPGWGAAFHKP